MKGRFERGERVEDRTRLRRIETEKEKRKVPRMSARRKRQSGVRSEGRREEWFTCIASIALAQGQRVCETEDQTGSGPPSFQFPAPCSLTAPHRAALLPTASNPLLFSLLGSFLHAVPLYNTQTIASRTRCCV